MAKWDQSAKAHDRITIKGQGRPEDKQHKTWIISKVPGWIDWETHLGANSIEDQQGSQLRVDEAKVGRDIFASQLAEGSLAAVSRVNRRWAQEDTVYEWRLRRLVILASGKSWPRLSYLLEERFSSIFSLSISQEKKPIGHWFFLITLKQRRRPLAKPKSLIADLRKRSPPP